MKLIDISRPIRTGNDELIAAPLKSATATVRSGAPAIDRPQFVRLD
ncbi:hypothetical protein [Oleiharenicola lentus]